MHLVRQATGPARSGVPVIAVVRDELHILPAFLKHYREIGAGSFIVVENASKDGSREFLRGQADVTLYTTSDSYAEANQGNLWLDGLSHRYLNGRWCVRADADEFLVFDGCDRGLTLAHLVSRLESRGERRLFAPILDCYPQGVVAQAHLLPGDDPLAVAPYFDGEREFVASTTRGTLVIGGVRDRLFKVRGKRSPWLSKYPLTLYDDATAFAHIHFPIPFVRNRVPMFGRLLHFKFTQAISRKIECALTERQYSCASTEYVVLQEALQNGTAVLHAPTSEIYRGSGGLVALGLMKSFPKSGRIRGAIDRWRMKPARSDLAEKLVDVKQ